MPLAIAARVGRMSISIYSRHTFASLIEIELLQSVHVYELKILLAWTFSSSTCSDSLHTLILDIATKLPFSLAHALHTFRRWWSRILTPI